MTRDLLIEKGFANVSTRDVADAAKLSRSHIYHYYATWPELRREAFELFARDALTRLKHAVTGLPPREALPVLFRILLQAKADKETLLWRGAWDEALRDPGLARTYLESDGDLRVLIREFIEAGVRDGDYRCPSPDRAARQITSMLLGYAETLLLASSEARFEEVLSDLEYAVSLLTLA